MELIVKIILYGFVALALVVGFWIMLKMINKDARDGGFNVKNQTTKL